MKRIRLVVLALVLAVVSAACDATSITANECDPTMGSGVDRSCS
jgi:hypothetical protein